MSWDTPDGVGSAAPRRNDRPHCDSGPIRRPESQVQGSSPSLSPPLGRQLRRSSKVLQENASSGSPQLRRAAAPLPIPRTSNGRDTHSRCRTNAFGCQPAKASGEPVVRLPRGMPIAPRQSIATWSFRHPRREECSNWLLLEMGGPQNHWASDYLRDITGDIRKERVQITSFITKCT